MKLASLPISINLAEALYQLGIRYDSVFYWYQEKFHEGLTLFETGKDQLTMLWKQHIGRPSFENRNVLKEYSAYTCNELGEILPGFITSQTDRYFISFGRNNKNWDYFYESYYHNKLFIVSAPTEQDARAMLLIKIIENKYIDVSKTIIK
jgi:hypothetical protein